jgi:hypothetical protein
MKAARAFCGNRFIKPALKLREWFARDIGFVKAGARVILAHISELSG